MGSDQGIFSFLLKTYTFLENLLCMEMNYRKFLPRLTHTYMYIILGIYVDLTGFSCYRSSRGLNSLLFVLNGIAGFAGFPCLCRSEG